jgi:ATP synthase protein I
MNHDSLVLTLIIGERALMSNPKKDKSILQMADLVTMGMAMVLCIVMGLIAGVYLDKWMETEPIFTLLFIVGGILAGFRIMYKTYMKFFAQENSRESKNDSSNG